MFQLIIIITFSLLLFFTTTLPALPNPDPATVQTQTLQPSPPSTIPAFPEQSDVSGCPLDLPDDLFKNIKSVCTTNHHHHNLPASNSYEGQLHRSRCCPILAAWLYSAYSKTVLRATTKSTTTTYDMPVLPDDSETCVDTVEKALVNRGIELGKPNETCDFVYCYCGIRLRPFSCPEAFKVVNDESGKVVVGGESVKKLERDCKSLDNGGGSGGCSKCFNSLNLLNGSKFGRSNKTAERTSKMHNRDCELMGLTWLLNKDRSAYIRTVSAVLRALMMNTEEDGSDPTYCSLNGDGMPLAVDSSQINDQSSSTIQQHVHPQHYLLCLSFLLMSLLFLFSTRY